jgi:hypothetical protein
LAANYHYLTLEDASSAKTIDGLLQRRRFDIVVNEIGG